MVKRWMHRTDRRSAASRITMMAAAALALAGCAGTDGARPRTALPAGARYVAMGSSFASGPGVGVSADTPANRCTRSAQNYAHQLARKRGLVLQDVSCGGAITKNLVGGWAELPPQVDALTPDTRLVTITIGGNDMGYLAGLISGVCFGSKAMTDPTVPRTCAPVSPPTEQAWAALDTALRGVVAEVRRRAPAARLIFVDYLTILPARGGCALTPVSDEQAARSRALADRLAATTARVAQETGAEVLRASALSRDHDACAATPWVTGFPDPVHFLGAGGRPTSAPYHPNLAGMTAIADALDAMLRR